ncbi:MAG: hypothetical protein LBK46_04350 [Oscillospiraceae bacterium]|jgi:transcriptional antiterminator NusG|nr:hypothetical protein [Oscillospiraceae bacterium]
MKTIEEKAALSKWFSAEANWFVLFVQTKSEVAVAERLQKRLDPELFTAFVPTKDYARRLKGQVTTNRLPWLNGYVFIVTMATPEECLRVVKPLVYYDSNVYKFLSNGGQLELSEHDRRIMTALLDESFNIPAFEAVRIGDLVKVTDGVLKGIGARVVRVNKHRQTAVIEVGLMRRMVEIEVMLEYLLTVMPQ